MTANGSDERADFAKRLNQALDKINFPVKGKGRQLELAKMFGISQHAARKWLEGESMPNTKRLPELAGRLQVTTEWLLSGRDLGPSKTGNLSTVGINFEIAHSVPIISWVQAGAFCDSGGPWVVEDETTQHVAHFGKLSASGFALEVRGDSMVNPHAGQVSFLPGSFVIIEPAKEASPGNYVVVRLPGTNEVTLKQLVSDAGELYLKPLNPQYSTQKFPKDGHVCGVVVGMQTNF
ncbi:LexA family protein [Endozoicomonas montiporae]|uniref:Transcriptional repressor pyocin R2_PP n=1 Tax=Endozoicomonas montiporae CL-33 TaxID=570277 RepID=A0A142BA74_9GAMM|nr:S24 family peptidase [Endozoicomonas montiporae]AMO55650.1 transcriptional repressor pyocin R2_PP [Endozoicomonas montiporae CL-33]